MKKESSIIEKDNSMTYDFDLHSRFQIIRVNPIKTLLSSFDAESLPREKH